MTTTVYQEKITEHMSEQFNFLLLFASSNDTSTEKWKLLNSLKC